MGVDRAPFGDREALGAQSLQPDIVGPRRDSAFDACGQQLLERREQHVLQIDGQRQQAIEKGSDRRQLVLDAVGVHQLQTGGVLQGLKRAAVHLTPDQKHVELPQRVAPVVAFEVILGPEQALAASLALAARDRAERVEAARDRAQEALLRLHVRGDRTEQRRLCLVGAVGAAETLDRRIGLPAGFEQVVDAQASIPRRQLGVVAASRAARFRENEDALGVIHEGGRLREVGRAGTVLDHQPIALADDAARASGHLGHHVGAKALDDLVEGAGDRRERGKLLDQAIAAGEGLAALDGLAVAIDRPGGEIALAIGEGLVELHREGMGKIIENVLPRRDVDLDVIPVLRRDLRQPAFHQRFAGRDNLDDGGMP